MTKALVLSCPSQVTDVARRICQALRAAELMAWSDRNALRDGDTWDASIRQQINECALFFQTAANNTQSNVEGDSRPAWKLAVDRAHLMGDDRGRLDLWHELQRLAPCDNRPAAR